MINPDVFFKSNYETSGMDIFTLFVVNNFGVIQAVTVGFMFLILWVWFWNFTKDWTVKNEA